MNFTREEINHLRDTLAEQYDQAYTGKPGQVITLRCEQDKPIVVGDVTYYGCGEILSKHKIFENSKSMWELIADLYILHLHNVHRFGEPFDEFE